MATVSKQQFLRARNHAANTYAKHSDIIDEVADRLLQRLDYMKLQPQTILDLGCATGYTTLQLKQRYKSAQVIALDPAEQLCGHVSRGWFSKTRTVVAWYDQLPIANESVDLLFSNLSLQWQSDWPVLAHELFRVLKPNGLLLFSVAGPDTLKELRAAWAYVDDNPHVLSFVDMHDIGDALLQQRFDDPVMDMEFLTLHYPSLNDLFSELRQLGCQNILQSRHSHCTSQQKFQHMQHAYPNPENVSATLEVIYGHAWKTEVNEQQAGVVAGEVAVPIRAIKRRR